MRSKLHEVVRNLQDIIKSGKKAEAIKELGASYKVIDTAVKKNILHRNTANRRKSSLAKAVDSIK